MSDGPATRATAPLVSVVVIFLDAAIYLDESVASILAQRDGEGPLPLEVLLVDDGSTDGSTELAQAWADRYPERVRRLEHPGHANRQMAQSRALGLRAARADWVAFLDADDVWEPDHLAGHLAAARARPEAGMVVGPALVWRSWGGGTDEVTALPGRPGEVLPVGGLLGAVTFGGLAVPVSAITFRRPLLRPDYPVPGLGLMFEDQVFIAHLTLEAPAVLVAAPTARYRQHDGSAVSRSPGYGQRDPVTLVYLSWIEPFLAARGVLTPEIAGRLAEVHGRFTPRWRFWLWWWSRRAYLALPAAWRLRVLQLRGRPIDRLPPAGPA